MARLTALVPKPRVNLTRFHGVFAPNSKLRALITPAKRGKGNKRQGSRKTDDCTPAKRHSAMTWAHGEKSEIKRIQPVTREQGTAPNRFVRVADEISLTLSTHQIAASKIRGR